MAKNIKLIYDLIKKGLKNVTKQLNKKHLKSTINASGKALMSYISLIAVVLCLINLIYLAELHSDIRDLQYSIEHINTEYDNSDVINAIGDAESNIISTVEDAESNLQRNIIIWND